MNRRDVERIIRAKYEDYADLIMERFQSLEGDAWRSFARDMQYGQSFVYEEYERQLEWFCNDLFKTLKDHELELLWLASDACFDHDEAKPGGRCEWEDGVREELAQRVRSAASDLDLDEGEEEDSGAFAFGDEDLGFFSEVAGVLSRLSTRPNSGPEEGRAIRRAVAALKRLPEPTPGINVQIEVAHSVGDDQFHERRICTVNLDSEQIEMSSTGSQYDASVGSDSYGLESFVWHANGECEAEGDHQTWLERLASILDDEEKRAYITDESEDGCPEDAS